MVHRRSKTPRGKATLGSHNRSWIWGRNVVAETLRAGKWPVLELAVSRRLEPGLFQEFLRRAHDLGVAVRETDDAELTRWCRAADHQGCAALMGEFPYLSREQLSSLARPDAVVLVLDRIQDPFNFGAIVRSGECLGIAGIVIGTKEQTGVNSLAARSSAGAVNHVPIARVDDVRGALSELSARGWRIWGASERGAVPLWEATFRPPMALVIGNEGTGISPELLAECAATVQIPMAGRVGSLNAAVSAGILCYEAIRACRGKPSGT